MRAFAIFAQLIVALASTGLSAQSDASYTAFLWTSSTNATYEASGIQSRGGMILISYGRRGELLGAISTGFYTNDFFGLFQDYYTNRFVYQDRFSHAVVEDYAALTNGYLLYKSHSVATNYYTPIHLAAAGSRGVSCTGPRPPVTANLLTPSPALRTIGDLTSKEHSKKFGIWTAISCPGLSTPGRMILCTSGNSR